MELTDIIRNKVRKALVLSLPPEKLDGYIREEWDRFFKADDRGYYSHPSQFKEMVLDEIRHRVRKQIIKWMDENFIKEWDGQQEKFLGDMVKKLTPIVMDEMATKVASETLATIYQRLQISS
jgi:hypothetical protein